MQKTDVHIQQDIIAELKWDPSIDPTHIQVEVQHGDVTLTGRVSSQAEKLNVERSVQRVFGVNAINTNLECSMPDSSKKSDSELTFRVINLLQWISYTEENSIEVTVENGWVSLTGELDCQYQKEAIVNTIQHLTGVAGIVNNTSIRQIASTEDIKSEIEDALKRHLDDKAEHVLIDVRMGEVALSGTVESWHDATIAIKSASSTRGVWKVQNNMRINCQ